MKSMKLKVDDALYRRVKEFCKLSGVAREDLVEALFKKVVARSRAKGGDARPLSLYLFPEMEEDLFGVPPATDDLHTSLAVEAGSAYVREMVRAFEGGVASASRG